MLLSTESDLMATVRGVVFTTEEGFTFGPYPDENELTMLKKEGYDGVITLLSPSVPFEKILLEKEIQAGEKVGLRIYSFPMRPWIFENKDSIIKIKEFVKTNQGKFYVHCYLGKHRTNMVRQIIKTEFGGPVTNKEFAYPDKLERGASVTVSVRARAY